MKRDKVDGVIDLVSNNFINGPDYMIMYLGDFMPVVSSMVSCLMICC